MVRMHPHCMYLSDPAIKQAEHGLILLEIKTTLEMIKKLY